MVRGAGEHEKRSAARDEDWEAWKVVLNGRFSDARLRRERAGQRPTPAPRHRTTQYTTHYNYKSIIAKDRNNQMYEKRK